MRANPFSILVSQTDDGPFATHLPLFLRATGDQLTIRGHVAKANPHWRHLENQPQCLTIFHGPHSYISPSLYATREVVPTWNYGAVHVYGNARGFSSAEALLEVLHELVGVFGPAYAQQVARLGQPTPHQLRKQGADVLEIPFIAIRRPRSFRPLDSALKNLQDYDWLILTSVNGVEALWERMQKLALDADRLFDAPGKVRVSGPDLKGRGFSRAVTIAKQQRALAPHDKRLQVAAIGPATKKAFEQRGVSVDVVPREYVAESVVQSLRRRVKGKRVLLVRAKVARDVIPHELRKAGAHVDVVEAYETVVPRTSRRRLKIALKNPVRRPHVIAFTSSSTVRNFVALLGPRRRADLD